MRSALLAVKGGAFENREAVVDYDPTQCRVSDLIAAVAAAKDPAMPGHVRRHVEAVTQR